MSPGQGKPTTLAEYSTRRSTLGGLKISASSKYHGIPSASSGYASATSGFSSASPVNITEPSWYSSASSGNITESSGYSSTSSGYRSEKSRCSSHSASSGYTTDSEAHPFPESYYYPNLSHLGDEGRLFHQSSLPTSHKQVQYTHNRLTCT